MVIHKIYKLSSHKCYRRNYFQLVISNAYRQAQVKCQRHARTC